jgi:5-exo-hydroxycamphor dehydrogenase
MKELSCKRAVLVGAEQPVEIWKFPVAGPGPGEVLLKTSLSGICGTDVHLQRGEVPLPGPIVLGHEGIGTIEARGAGVATDFAGAPISDGDRVFYVPMMPCMRCHYCTVQKDATNCENMMAGLFTPADESPVCTHCEYTRLPSSVAFYRIPDQTPSEAVIAFGCALPTILQGLERIGGVKTGQNVVIQGLGPVGQAATMMSSLGGAGRIITIDGNPGRLARAADFGATHAVSFADFPSVESRVERIHELTDGRGADVVIEAAGVVAAFAEGIQLVAKGGTYLVCGLWSAPGTVEIEPRIINNMNMRIKGTSMYEARHIALAVSVATANHERYPMVGAVTHKFRLEQMQDALDCVARGEPVKAVVAFGGE